MTDIESTVSLLRACDAGEVGQPRALLAAGAAGLRELSDRMGGSGASPAPVPSERHRPAAACRGAWSCEKTSEEALIQVGRDKVPFPPSAKPGLEVSHHVSRQNTWISVRPFQTQSRFL